MNLIQALRLSDVASKPIVALAGAGGKSALLFRLGSELAAAGQATLLTATTRLRVEQVNRAPFTLLSASEPTLAFELPTSLRGYGQALAMAGPAGEPGKLAGLAPELVCRLAALEEVDAVVIEADGSRERPLKAPASHEPSIPTCATHVIVIAGMAAVGQPLDAATVHRPERFAALAGLSVGDLLTPQAIAAVLVHPDGGRQGCPGDAIPLLYLNLALDNTASPAVAEQRTAAARSIAALALAGPSPAFRAVLIGSAQRAEPVDQVYGRVAAVVLAAGGSSRLGGGAAKQLLPWQPGETLVGRAVGIALAAGAVDEVVVVVGHRADEVQAALGERPVRVVVAPDWQDGQSSSVAAGLAALGPEVSAALFVLADQPDVTPATIDRLVERHRRSLAPVVAPVYQDGQRGNPVLFDRRVFPELLALEGDTGGRPLIRRYGAEVQTVEIDAPQPQGIETLAQYQRLRAAAP
ncbi:MAG: selenium cofactor biosynthesis protein YqeC [Anaerolineae bacterium]